jgi:hypothetical protein
MNALVDALKRAGKPTFIDMPATPAKLRKLIASR